MLLTEIDTNRKIFQDEKTIKSLPFLFYKDGMQKLTFHNGLKKEELREFMEIIKKVYDQPGASTPEQHAGDKDSFLFPFLNQRETRQ